jgi:hypothetical protein
MSKLDPMFGDTPMPELDLTEMRALDVITTGASSEGETPEQAWRARIESGAAPRSWLNDEKRRFPDQDVTFFCTECNGRGATGYNYDDVCNACGGKACTMTRGSVALPTDHEDVQWMIPSAARVELAEALAREAVRRLAKLNPKAPQTDVVQWGRLRKGKPHGTIAVLIESAISERLRPSLPTWDHYVIRDKLFVYAPWRAHVRHLHRLTQEILHFDLAHAWAHRATNVAESPMEPVLKLWELGVCVEELTPEAIVLDRVSRRYISYWSAGVPLTTSW